MSENSIDQRIANLNLKEKFEKEGRSYVEADAEGNIIKHPAREAKQVIVMRADLGMRKGKMIAQGAHASVAFLTNKIRPAVAPGLFGPITMTEAEEAWATGSFVKVCVRVDSEEELLDVVRRAQEAGLTVQLIQDAGRTEFGGVPTYTCAAIGPNWGDEIDVITGELKLL